MSFYSWKPWDKFKWNVIPVVVVKAQASEPTEVVVFVCLLGSTKPMEDETIRQKNGESNVQDAKGQESAGFSVLPGGQHVHRGRREPSDESVAHLVGHKTRLGSHPVADRVSKAVEGCRHFAFPPAWGRASVQIGWIPQPIRGRSLDAF